MKTLVIDIEKHFPPLAQMFDADYYCPVLEPDEFKQLQPVPTNTEVKDIYDIDVIELEDLGQKYDVAMIVWPIQSFDDSLEEFEDLRDGTRKQIERKEYFENKIFPLLEKKGVNKVLWFDDCDRAIAGKGIDWLLDNHHPCDAVFKREYRRTHTYDYYAFVHPFPFMTFGKPNPPWLLYKNRVKGSAKEHGCFWSGAPINRFQAGVSDEWCNRLGMLQQIHPMLIMKSGLPKEEFLQQFNTYKCFLHLNGTGHLCGRFFEGLSRDSLMISQKMDTIFPFEDELFFHDATIFEMPHEFAKKYDALMNDDQLYDECKSRQEEVLEKYFNYDYIKNYILERM